MWLSSCEAARSAPALKMRRQSVVSSALLCPRVCLCASASLRECVLVRLCLLRSLLCVSLAPCDFGGAASMIRLRFSASRLRACTRCTPVAWSCLIPSAVMVLFNCCLLILRLYLFFFLLFVGECYACSTVFSLES